MKIKLFKHLFIYLSLLLSSYTVSAQACTAPTWINVDDITLTNVIVSCEPVPGALAYQFVYSTELSPPVIITTSTPNASFMVMPGDITYCSVNTICPDGNILDGAGIVVTVDIVYEKTMEDFKCANLNIPFNSDIYETGGKSFSIKNIDKCCACLKLMQLYENKELKSNGKYYIIEKEQFKCINTCKKSLGVDPCATERVTERLGNNSSNNNEQKTKMENIVVYDINGRTILEINNTNELTDEELTTKIKNNNIVSGLYIVHIISNNKPVVKKIVIE